MSHWIPISHTDDSIKLLKSQKLNRKMEKRKWNKLTKFPLLLLFDEIWHGMSESRSLFFLAQFELQMLRRHFSLNDFHIRAVIMITHQIILFHSNRDECESSYSDMSVIPSSLDFVLKMAKFVNFNILAFFFFWNEFSWVELLIGKEVRWCYCTFHRASVDEYYYYIIIFIGVKW